MTPARDPLPRLYTAAEVAGALNCSSWWVKEQARQRRIPFTWIGGAYRFTDEHLAEIIRSFEVRPTTDPATSDEPRPTGSGPVRRRPVEEIQQAAPRLRARPPRRVRAPRDSAA